MTIESAPMTDTETKAQELSRLITEFDYGERQNRNEAWNLIAEFAYDNAEQICEALSAAPKPQGDDLEPVADDLAQRLVDMNPWTDTYWPELLQEAASALQSLKAERDAALRIINEMLARQANAAALADVTSKVCGDVLGTVKA